jgi:cyclopropane fatty-acyl-phospholipid synthase-like methyltransferase
VNGISAVESILGRHHFYRAFRKLTGSDRVNREFVEKYIRPHEQDRILDIGCGPADVFAFMQQVRYTGIDASQNYIDFARNRFGSNGTFLCGDLKALETDWQTSFDAVISMGVIHHLNDEEVKQMLRKVPCLLKPQGRFLSYDPCFTERQHPVARWIHKHDRGRFVRFAEHYEKLLSSVFPSYRKHIRTDLCTVPATVIIFECDRPD